MLYCLVLICLYTKLSRGSSKFTSGLPEFLNATATTTSNFIATTATMKTGNPLISILSQRMATSYLGQRDSDMWSLDFGPGTSNSWNPNDLESGFPTLAPGPSLTSADNTYSTDAAAATSVPTNSLMSGSLALVPTLMPLRPTILDTTWADLPTGTQSQSGLGSTMISTIADVISELSSGSQMPSSMSHQDLPIWPSATSSMPYVTATILSTFVTQRIPPTIPSTTRSRVLIPSSSPATSTTANLTLPPSTKHAFSKKAIVGIVVGLASTITLTIMGLLILRRRERKVSDQERLSEIFKGRNFVPLGRPTSSSRNALGVDKDYVDPWRISWGKRWVAR